MDQVKSLDEEEIKYRFQSMIRAEHATYAAFQRPRYVKLVRRMEQLMANRIRKESGDYRILKRFEVCTVDGEKRLMKKGTGKMFVCTDELFEIIKKAHYDSKQKGETKILSELAKTYANITRDQVKAFLHLCSCQLCVRIKVQTDLVLETDVKESGALSSDAGAANPHSVFEEIINIEQLRNEGNAHISAPDTSNETGAKEQSDTGANKSHSIFKELINNEQLSNEDNVQMSVPTTSRGAYKRNLVENSLATNISAVPIRKKRGRPSHAGTTNGSPSESANENKVAQKRVVANNDALPIRKKRGRPSLAPPVDALKQCEVLMKEDDARLEFNESCSAEPAQELQYNQVNGHRPFAIEDAVRNALEDTETMHAESVGECLQQLAECQRQLLYVESRRLAIEEVRLQVDQQVAASLLEIVNHLKQNNDKTSNPI